ncbi:MAG: Asp/Glu racemase [Mesorhizobium sp. SCN 65-20]|nr:MAG: Asp/Glu racemase [Mesorhizobium sp. SCN 65-20]
MPTCRAGEKLPDLIQPIAVFDAGIGSYAAVAAIRRKLPLQDILYFADRASFPYGDKSRPELLAILKRTLRFLDGFEPAAVLVASNAPSITVLDEIEGMSARPVFGVRPPIAEALALTGTRDVVVLGVRSMVVSPELRAYAHAQAKGRARQVKLVDASCLVDLVESGAFLFAPDTTRSAINSFLDELDARHPNIGAVTLSSTHLPWLRSYLEKARPDLPFLDPLDNAIEAIVRHSATGTGTALGLVSESERYRAADFRQMLDRLGISLRLHAVRV